MRQITHPTALLFILLSLLLVNCAGLPSVEPQSTATAQKTPEFAVSGQALDGTRWKLLSMDGQPPLSGTEITLVFEDEDVYGEAGCNHYYGKYAADSQQLQFSRIAINVELCFDLNEAKTPVPGRTLMDQEERYIDTLTALVLYQPATYRLIDGQLRILDAGGTAILIYEKVGS